MLLPDEKTKLNINLIHRWRKYEAISKVFDLALIELSEEVQVSKKESQIIFSMAPLKTEYHPNEEFEIHSMLMKSTNALEFIITYCTILDAFKCATILPKSENHRKVEEKSQKRGTFSKDEKKEYKSGYIMESLDILTEQKCMESLHMRKMKDKIKLTFCSVTVQNQNAKEKVSNE